MLFSIKTRAKIYLSLYKYKGNRRKSDIFVPRKRFITVNFSFRFWLTACLTALVLTGTVEAQQRHPLRVMTWNVENLFDTVHDVGFNDEEFLPSSERHWTSARYLKKLMDVARVVAAVSDEHGLPGLIGLCEVENDSVLTRLTQRTPLRLLGYHYVMTHSEDARGIDVALLYQPAHFRLLESRSIRIPSRDHGYAPTRDILYAKGLVLKDEGTDTLHVFLVHLPSRASGHAADGHRLLAAQKLWEEVQKIREELVVVMGDFNAGAKDKVFHQSPLLLTDDADDAGTYCFRGFWQWLDHILISPAVKTKKAAHPFRMPWLMEENKTYGGYMPRRTYRGPTFHGGISDHLPVVLELDF